METGGSGGVGRPQVSFCAPAGRGSVVEEGRPPPASGTRTQPSPSQAARSNAGHALHDRRVGPRAQSAAVAQSAVGTPVPGAWVREAAGSAPGPGVAPAPPVASRCGGWPEGCGPRIAPPFRADQHRPELPSAVALVYLLLATEVATSRWTTSAGPMACSG